MEDESDRRGFMATTSSVAMAAGLAAGYGTFFAMAGRFLFPAGSDVTGWMFVAEVDRLRVGDSMTYVAPNGAKVVVARQQEKGTAADFIALSSTCPHLGCQVHWESANGRFFCPCHNGTFDSQGQATGGPPFTAGQSLPRYPLRIERGLLFIEAPLERVV
jgi:Rieske Fe-S protein